MFPPKLVRKTIEVLIWLIDHRAAGPRIDPRLLEYESERRVPQEGACVYESGCDRHEGGLRKANAAVSTLDHSGAAKDATFICNLEQNVNGLAVRGGAREVDDLVTDIGTARHSRYDGQRIGFYPPCGSMVDKISGTDPLGSGRSGMGFVRRARWRGGVRFAAKAWRVGWHDRSRIVHEGDIEAPWTMAEGPARVNGRGKDECCRGAAQGGVRSADQSQPSL